MHACVSVYPPQFVLRPRICMAARSRGKRRAKEQQHVETKSNQGKACFCSACVSRCLTQYRDIFLLGKRRGKRRGEEGGTAGIKQQMVSLQSHHAPHTPPPCVLTCITPLERICNVLGFMQRFYLLLPCYFLINQGSSK